MIRGVNLMSPASLLMFFVTMDPAMQTGTHPYPAHLLQIVREPLKPGAEEAYDRLEQDQARISAALGCPNPYLGAETLTGRKEVWWFNAYASEDDKRRIYDAYSQNTRLMTALQRNSRIKKRLTL